MDKAAIVTRLARAAIARHLGIAFESPPSDADWLHAPGASFVTLHRGEELRGCIGSLVARRPLAEDIRDNAVNAAFHDPRFPPLAANEFDEVDIEVSLLSAPEPLHFSSREELVAMLRPGVDGLILSCNGRRGTFLPQVWRQLPDADAFLRHLNLKAGLPADFWSPEIEISRYGVEAFHEQEKPT